MRAHETLMHLLLPHVAVSIHMQADVSCETRPQPMLAVHAECCGATVPLGRTDWCRRVGTGADRWLHMHAGGHEIFVIFREVWHRGARPVGALRSGLALAVAPPGLGSAQSDRVQACFSAAGPAGWRR